MSEFPRCTTLPLLTIASILAASSTAHAQQSLDSAANDPTASLMSFILQDFYTYDYHNGDASKNLLQFRAAIPFEMGGVSNIFRITVPYVTQGPGGADGWSDITVFNLATFDRVWGRFGVGAVALLPTGDPGTSAEKWGLGPAAGFIAQEQWGLWGLFNQNIFTVDGKDAYRDVNVSIVQPILNYKLGGGWSLGTSDMSITYDWDAGDWVSQPLGVAVNKMVQAGGRPLQLSLSYEHNFFDEGRVPSDTVNFTAKLLVPRN